MPDQPVFELGTRQEWDVCPMASRLVWYAVVNTCDGSEAPSRDPTHRHGMEGADYVGAIKATR